MGKVDTRVHLQATPYLLIYEQRDSADESITSSTLPGDAHIAPAEAPFVQTPGYSVNVCGVLLQSDSIARVVNNDATSEGKYFNDIVLQAALAMAQGTLRESTTGCTKVRKVDVTAVPLLTSFFLEKLRINSVKMPLEAALQIQEKEFVNAGITLCGTPVYFMPVNDRAGQHWYGVVVINSTGTGPPVHTIVVFDSLRRRSQPGVTELCRALKAAGASEVGIVYARGPTQVNAYDCGAHVAAVYHWLVSADESSCRFRSEPKRAASREFAAEVKAFIGPEAAAAVRQRLTMLILAAMSETQT